MENKDYKQKKRECWEEYWKPRKAYRHGDAAEMVHYDAFSYAFDRAYALGKEKETITREDVEKAAYGYVLTRQQARHNAKRDEEATMRDFDKTIKAWDAYDMEQSFEAGANFTLGKQEKDAEGEEMLTVSRKDVQKIYKESKHIVSNEVYGSKIYSMHLQIMCVLENLFGSKCLPDESESPILSKVEKIGKDCKAEPKFIVGDEVVFEESVHIVVGILPNLRLYYLSGCEDAVAESDLEPYAEPLSQNPTENCDNENVISSTKTCANVCPSPRPSQEESNRGLCDKLIQRGFKNHNRLHLAAMAMQAIISRGKGYDAQETAVTALEFADALIAEAEKGGKQ